MFFFGLFNKEANLKAPTESKPSFSILSIAVRDARQDGLKKKWNMRKTRILTVFTFLVNSASHHTIGENF